MMLLMCVSCCCVGGGGGDGDGDVNAIQKHIPTPENQAGAKILEVCMSCDVI